MASATPRVLVQPDPYEGLSPSRLSLPLWRRVGVGAPSIAVTLGLALAAAVRFRALPGGGPIAYDEGWAMANGRFLVSTLMHPAGWGRVLHGGHLLVFGSDGKLAHDLVLGLLLSIGVSPTDLSWYSAIAGMVMAVVLAALAWRYWGAAAGAVAGVFAAAMPLSIIYGHLLIADADSIAVLCIGLYLVSRWWDGRPRRSLVVFTLLAVAAALALNYRMLPVVLPIILLLAYLGWAYRRPDAEGVRPPARLMIGLTLVPAGTLILGYFVLDVLTIAGVHHASWLRHLLRAGPGLSLPFAQADFYPHVLWTYGGPLIAVLTVAAIAVLSWRRQALDPLATLSLGSLLGILMFFSAAQDKAPRTMAVAVPFAALLLARAVSLLGRAATSRWLAAVAVSATCLLSGLFDPTPTIPSGTAQAGNWLAAHPGGIVASRAPIFVLYTEHRWDAAAGPDPAHALVRPSTVATPSALRATGARWVVVDAHGLVVNQSPVYRTLLACGRPVAQFADPAGWSARQVLDDADTLHLGYDGSLALVDRWRALAGPAIRIYDLEGPGTAGC